MSLEMGNTNTYLRATGSLDAADEAVTIDNLRGAGSVSVQLTGTFVGTVTFEVSNTGATGEWVSIELTTPSGAAAASTATTTGIYCGPIGSLFKFRVRCSAYTSGTIVTTVCTSPAGYISL